MPLFYTARYIKRFAAGQEFFTGRYENILAGYLPGHIARLVSTSACSCALVAPLPAWIDMP